MTNHPTAVTDLEGWEADIDDDGNLVVGQALYEFLSVAAENQNITVEALVDNAIRSLLDEHHATNTAPTAAITTGPSPPTGSSG